MRIAQKMGGFSLGQADILRKAMGKKMLDKMESMKTQFIAGAKKQNIKEKVANEVYGIMVKFAEYGFNKAHATVYAHVSYQAAFLKANFTKEYMTAVLTSHIGEKEKFLAAKNEAERFGIQVRPPDINTSEIDCNIKEGCICLGLSVIANVGKAADAIIKTRTKIGTFKSLFDFCRNIDLRLVNKKTIESLIMAGAMDSLPGTRAQLFAAIEKAIEYGNTFQKDRQTGQTNLFSALTESGDDNEAASSSSFLLPEPDLPDISPWPYNILLAKEKEVLNFYMSGHPLDHYRDEIQGFSTISLSESGIAKTKEGDSVLLGGVITSIKNKTQRNGKPMAFLELEDFNGSLELIAFAEAYEQFSHLCAIDSMVFVRGAIQKKEGNQHAKIIVEKMMPLSEVREKLTKSVHLKVSTQGLEEEFIQELYDQCVNHKGSCALVLHLVTQENNEYKMRAKQVQISPEKKVLESFRAKLGQDNVWLSQKIA